ncbi:uncharacterized protein GGS22DRAFT_193223 [Annulohypoxylon maeteangense]|uniref:uncharacterized protein n=1 Tax=Annulohypoxylon maeteangense TaxID=1927788 RepID=UPI002007DD4A|nr:uncharacterized protein GGS22DRAFT_193223 [Annulohypoxylon maeteangense]KAI0880452.1 hypothetical protein GGS22DRAFT_193223 [Annulohypoxylon maeteangense]
MGSQHKKTSRDLIQTRPSTDRSRNIFATKNSSENHGEAKDTESKMSGSESQPCTFADVAVSYRVYILDDLLAEPQEIVHDWSRNLLYISQRHRQGNNFAPIELSHEISIFDISIGDITSTIDISPYTGPHCMELDAACSYIHVHVDGGTIWIDPESRLVTNFEPAQKRRREGRTSEDFIAEIDLRSGKMRQRVNVPEGDRHSSDGRHVTFSAPAIRFASRSSSSGLPVVDVASDPVIDAIRAKFPVRTIYVTSRNIMLV